jgi:hypothetical protein
LLGGDFTGSSIKVLETNPHLYLTDKIEPNSIENLWQKQFKNTVNVPIIGDTISTHSVITNFEAWIPPFSLVSIPFSLEKADNLQFMTRSKEQTPTFEVNQIIQPILKCPAHYLLFQISIPVYNPTAEDIFVGKSEQLAKIVFWSDHHPIYNFTIAPDSSELLTASNLKFSSDKNLSEEEKTKAFQPYLETGKYTMPMSSFIEKTPSITEISYKNIKPFDDTDFEKQFDLKHLPRHIRRQALRIFNKNKQVFSKHEMDLGCSQNLQMEIEVDITKPRIQKYYLLPHAVRELVRKVLDQMLEFNIIRECPEPSLFVSNLLVTKKKNGDYRILLDGRLLNNATIRHATF